MSRPSCAILRLYNTFYADSIFVSRLPTLRNPMTDECFAYVWQYTIEPAHRSEFLAAYDSRGEWVRLFSSDPAYIKTLLLQDFADENRYMTIDFWKSKADRDAFRERNSVEFDELDKSCEAFTVEERFLGDYLKLDENSAL